MPSTRRFGKAVTVWILPSQYEKVMSLVDEEHIQADILRRAIKLGLEAIEEGKA